MLKAWVKQVSQKMAPDSNQDFQDILQEMEAIMKMQLPERLSPEDALAAVQQRLSSLLSDWEQSTNKNYQRAAEYFRTTWEKKAGAPHACCTCSARITHCATATMHKMSHSHKMHGSSLRMPCTLLLCCSLCKAAADCAC